MYREGTEIELQAVTQAGSRVDTQILTIKRMNLDQLIEQAGKMAEQMRWRKFSLCIQGRWSRWHYTNI